MYIDLPTKDVPLPLISVVDVGHVVVELLKQGRQYINKTVSICAQRITVNEIAATFSSIFSPWRFKNRQVCISIYPRSIF